MEKLSVPQWERDYCCICFNRGNNKTLTTVNSGEMFKMCEPYLDQLIIFSLDIENPMSCCSYCNESVHQLRLLEEQLQKLQKEILDLSSLFSENVLERRKRFRITNENDKSAKKSDRITNKRLPIHTSRDSHSNSVIENLNVKREIIECESKELPSGSHTETERDDFVTDMCLDDEEFETVHQDDCEIDIHPEEAIEMKYFWNETVPKIVIEHPRLTSTNAHVNQQEKTASMEELLKTVEMPIIYLKRIQPDVSGTSKETVLNATNGGINWKKDLENFSEATSYSSGSSEKLSKVDRLKTGEISCSKSFKGAISLNKQQQIHSDEKPRKLGTRKKLRSQERRHQCLQCEKSFKQFHHLKYHERIHSGEKPYQCSSCEKSFTRAAILKRHKLIHSEERPYKCAFCEKCFKKTDTLKAHENIHFGERSFKCSFCSKSFLRSNALKKHERCHTGEKPHKCSTCGMAFREKHHLTTHQRTHVKNPEEFILP